MTSNGENRFSNEFERQGRKAPCIGATLVNRHPAPASRRVRTTSASRRRRLLSRPISIREAKPIVIDFRHNPIADRNRNRPFPRSSSFCFVQSLKTRRPTPPDRPPLFPTSAAFAVEPLPTAEGQYRKSSEEQLKWRRSCGDCRGIDGGNRIGSRFGQCPCADSGRPIAGIG